MQIQEDQGTTRNDFNEPVPSWVTVAWRYADVQSLDDAEMFSAQQVRAVANFRIVMRYYDLKPTHRIKWGSRIFQVVPADNPGERQRGTEMSVMAKEEV